MDQLQAFLSVSETASFSRAAQQLFVTQPAVSKRVSALEQALGTRLFDRIGHSIRLTEAGQALLPRARQILLDIEDSRRAVQNLSGAVAGILCIGTSHHIGLHRLPPVLRRYSQAYRDVQLDIRFMDSEAACNAVERGELELGIVTLPIEPYQHMYTVPIWPDPLQLVVAIDHPLARAKTVNPVQLASYSAILPAKGTYTREVIERCLAPYNLQLQVSLSTNYLETIKMLVSVGLGWSILPLSMLDAEIAAAPLAPLQLQRTLGVVYHKERTLSNAGKALLETLKAAAAG